MQGILDRPSAHYWLGTQSTANLHCIALCSTITCAGEARLQGPPQRGQITCYINRTT